MTQAKVGDTVRVHYTGRLKDGTEFDSSEGNEPLEFVIGQGDVIPGFENAVVGMEEGETKTEKITPEQAFGPFRDEMVQEIERSEFAADFELEVGQHLRVSQPDMEPIMLTVVDLSDEMVTVDANHPLAGKEVEFDIELVSVG